MGKGFKRYFLESRDATGGSA